MHKSDRQKACEAVESGVKTYIPARSCAKCGTSERYASNRGCVECVHRRAMLNRRKKREYNKQYYARNKDRMLENGKEWRERNIEHCKARDLKYHSKNKHRRNNQSREYYRRQMRTDEGRRKQKQYQRKYWESDKGMKARREYERGRRRNDLQYRVARNLRSQFGYYVSGECKNDSVIELLGCSLEFFRGYIASQFVDGMSWSNYGQWELDHITPASWFDMTDKTQQRLCWHYTNFQPLWKADNVRKGNRYAGNASGVNTTTEV